MSALFDVFVKLLIVKPVDLSIQWIVVRDLSCCVLTIQRVFNAISSFKYLLSRFLNFSCHEEVKLFS